MLEQLCLHAAEHLVVPPGLALDLSETGYVWRQKGESLLGTQSSWKRLLEKPMSVGRYLGDTL